MASLYELYYPFFEFDKANINDNKDKKDETKNDIKVINSVSKKIIKAIADKYHLSTNKDGLRINLATDDLDKIQDMLHSINNGDKIEFIKVIEPSSINKFLYKASTEYFSYLVKLKDDCEYGKQNEYGIIINLFVKKSGKQQNIKSQINKKQLTPSNLKLIGIKLDIHTLKNNVKNGINDLALDNDIKDTLIQLFLEIIDNTKSIPLPRDGIAEFKSNKDIIIFSQELYKKLLKLPQNDINTIGVDFGEVLGAGYLLKKYSCRYVEFPAASNYPLVDFFIDGQGVSSKYKKGAAPSINSLINQLYNFPEIKNSLMQTIPGKKLIEILDIIDSNPVGYNVILCHNYLRTKFSDFIHKNKLLKPTHNETFKAINEYVRKYSNILPDIYKNILDGTSAKQESINDLLMSPDIDAAGLLISPATFNLVNILNSDEHLLRTLNQLAQTLKIKQLHLYIKINAKAIIFDLKAYETSEFKFHFSGSAKEYKTNNIGFKIS